jgi:hypothetical protein
MSSGGLSSRCYHSRSRRTRWGVTGPGFLAGLLPGILIRLVTGASWVDIQAILDRQVSDTTLRARRDEWIEAGCSTRSRPKRSHRSIGSSGST